MFIQFHIYFLIQNTCKTIEFMVGYKTTFFQKVIYPKEGYDRGSKENRRAYSHVRNRR